MARLPRIVLPGIPHHMTRRSNRHEQVFFEDGDYDSISTCCPMRRRSGVAIWSHCLMPNHVHIIATQSDDDGLRRTFRYVHRHYTGYINARLRVTGHLWQGRFSSVAINEARLVSALRYVAFNPMRARLVARAEEWRWSSTRALLAGESDDLLDVAPAQERVGTFATFLGEAFDEAMSYAALREAASVGRPVGTKQWLADMEARTGSTLAPAKRGPKPNKDVASV
jgi:putative transposase